MSLEVIRQVRAEAFLTKFQQTPVAWEVLGLIASTEDYVQDEMCLVLFRIWVHPQMNSRATVSRERGKYDLHRLPWLQ